MVQSIQRAIRRLPSLCPTLCGPAGHHLCLWPRAPTLGPGLGVLGARSRAWLGSWSGPGARAWMVVVTDN
jgi:hypothetical protein